MLSYAFSTASTYFHLPVDEQEDKDINEYQRKYITWVSDPSVSSSSSSTSTTFSPSSSQAQNQTTKALDEVLAHEDLYSILGVANSPGLDKLTLRRAYLSRSRACHPDKFPNNPRATFAFQKIAVAYSVLSQPSSRRSYDARAANYDVFSSHPTGHAQETFRTIVMSFFDDFLEGDLSHVRTLLKGIHDMNPSLSLGEEGINSILNSLQRIRERALTCRACVFALHTELARLLEVQHSFRQLSYFDVLGRTRLTIQLTRITLSMPIALERAIAEQNVGYRDNPSAVDETGVLLPRRVTLLIRGVDVLLQRMERMLK